MKPQNKRLIQGCSVKIQEGYKAAAALYRMLGNVVSQLWTKHKQLT